MPFIAPALIVAAEAVAAVGSFVTSLGVIGSGLIAGGIGVASSFLISALSPKANADSVQGGVNFERQYGNNVPRQVACGLVGIAGHDTYVNTFNPSNRTMQQIYTLSDYYSTALTRVAVDGVWVIIGPDIGDGKGHQLMPTTAEQQWSGSIWVKFLDGRQTAADGFLTAFANPVGRWGADCVGLGITAVSVLLEFDKDHNNSYPDFFFEFQGAPIYDWRKDSTNGGSGTHRWNNVATHEYTTNPILIERHYRRGFSVNGDLFCGMDMQESDLPVNKWTVAANVCAEIDIDDGLPRYQISVLLDCMQPHSSNLQSLSLSCGSMQIDSVDGSWPLVGTDQPAVITFTDDDIISVADSDFTRYKSMGELVNSVSGNYPEPGQLWSMIGYNEQIADAYLVIDRRTRDLSMDFPMVPIARQAAQLAFIYLYENRFEALANLTLRPRFQVLEEGDWIIWNSAQYGLFTFIITSKGLRSLESDGPRNAVLQLQQRDGGIYDGITPVPIVFPAPNAGPVYLAEVQTFGLVPIVIQGPLGRAVPAIRASWTPTIPVDVTVTEIELIYFPVAQPTQVLTKTVKADVSVVNLSEGIVSNTLYAVQPKIHTNPSRVTVFGAGATITTLNVTVVMADLADELAYQVTDIASLFDDRLARVEALISSVGGNIEGRLWNDKKELRSQLASRSGAAFAAISTLQTVMTTADAAIATEVHTVEANVAVNTSNISTNTTAISNLSSSFASYQISVIATYATQTALGTTNTNLGTTNAAVAVNATAIATQAGYAAAQYSITLDVNGYGVGFNLINGGGGIGAAVFTVPKFQIASPGVGGGAAVPIFTVGNVAGSPKVGIRGDMFIDGTINAQNAVITGSITASLIGALQINTAALAINSVDILNIIAGAATKYYSTPIPAQPTGVTGTFNLLVGGSGFVCNILSGTAFVMLNLDVNFGSPTTINLIMDGTIYKAWFFNGAFGTSLMWMIPAASGNRNFQLQFITGASPDTWGTGQFYVQDLRR